MVLTVWSQDTRRHEPRGEVYVGVQTVGTEVPERVDRILAALAEAGHPLVVAQPHDDTILRQVHAPDFVEHLRGVHQAWTESWIPAEVGQGQVVPYLFATAGMLGGIPARMPTAVQARAGVYGYDTMTLVGPGTWEAARAAVDCALTAVDNVLADGCEVAYALCRPPGHHVTRSAYGGSCYLNNAAVATEALRAGGYERVAVVDVDAHQGNGTAAIFYDRPDVFYGSVHVDPAHGWFPHLVGFADETGAGDGIGTTLNIPLAPDTPDEPWLAGIQELAAQVARHGASALVVSLGVDAAADDPESPLLITSDGYRSAGVLLGSLGLPVVAVQEGGYHLPSLGGLVAAFLDGLESGRPGSS